jgi:hypothetical protein
MSTRVFLAVLLAGLFLASNLSAPLPACCPAPPSGKPVVNADQTVILLWDPDSKTEHFIRQASFKSDADDFGFLVPTPAQPVLKESGNDAFPYLRKLTEPEKRQVQAPSGVSCGCGSKNAVGLSNGALPQVTVLQEKLVAGFHAVVLEAKSGSDLTRWLQDHGYAYSPEVAAWARPYVESGWKITALKVAKASDDKKDKTVAASALRISFRTDRPLFPYREPDPRSQAAALDAKHRLLRIYFIGDARYRGELTREVPWTGTVAWANELKAADRTEMLARLKLPETTGPARWWLTEFEDDWPYRVAPADVYFSRDQDQSSVKRPPIIEYVSSPLPRDVMVYAIATALVLPPLARRLRRRRAARAGG